MGHVRRARMDHYAAPAISCNHNENMLQLIAGHMGYPEVIDLDWLKFETILFGKGHKENRLYEP